MIAESMRSSSSDCTVYFKAQGLPAPPFPLEVLRAIRPTAPGVFETPGWVGGLPVHAAALRWLESGCAEREAWCGMVRRGEYASTVQVGLVAPRYGLFMRKFSTPPFTPEQRPRQTRVEGTFEMMRRIIEVIDLARVWPRGQRLALVDDDTQQVLRWAWVAETNAEWDDLAPDSMGWLSALMSMERLLYTPP